jgi:hypothetical protein
LLKRGLSQSNSKVSLFEKECPMRRSALHACLWPSLVLLAACSAGQDLTGATEGALTPAGPDGGGPSGGGAGSDPLQNPQPDDNLVLVLDNATLQAIRDTHPGPPIVARALAITHTAIYDAWAAYDAHALGTRLGGTLRRPHAERSRANRTTAVAYAGYRALIDLFPQPAEKPLFDAVLTKLGLDPNDTSMDVHTAAGVGNVAAAAVLAFRHHDGSNQLGDLHAPPYSDYTGYAPVNTPEKVDDPNRWQPLRISDGHGGTVVQTFIAPFWRNVVPFALPSSDFVQPPKRYDPFYYPAKGYVTQAEEILEYSAELTDKQKVIAEYWADGPSSELPPGHWALFAQFVSRRDRHTLGQDAKMFFALTNAILDASIASWDAKRTVDYVRPVTAVHFLFSGKQVRAWAGPGKGTQLIDGADWRPYQAPTVVTPPFAEWYSGHSVFSRTGAEILKRFTGSECFGNEYTNEAGVSRVEPGITPRKAVVLHWRTFEDASDEAGISRRYGGIHFVHGDLAGRAVAPEIAELTWKKALTLFNDDRDQDSDDDESIERMQRRTHGDIERFCRAQAESCEDGHGHHDHDDRTGHR